MQPVSQPQRTRDRIGWTGSLLSLFLLLGTALPVEGQQSPGPDLTLEEALEIAARNNPDFLAQRNTESAADWAVREAYGALLPGATASSGFQYQAPGQTRFGIFTGGDIGIGEETGYYLSDYSLSLNYGLSGTDLYRVRQEKAARSATRADTDAARFALSTAVTRQYLAVRRAADAQALMSRQLESADENLKLARARVQVGAAIPLEAIQAEVQRGRVEVELLRAESALRTARLRLSEQLGVVLGPDVSLTTEFDVVMIGWGPEELVSMAADANPMLRAQRARTRAAEAAVTMARSSYFPRLDVNLGWSGFAREASNPDFLLNQARSQVASQREGCLLFNAVNDRLTEPLPGFPVDCSALELTPGEEARILSSNDAFPFDFTGQPFSARFQISVPIFTGFSRQRQIEQAKVQASNLALRVRAEEVRVRVDVVTAHDALTTAARLVELERRNLEGAEEQLRLARELYRVGSGSFIELLEAEALLAEAERSRLTAVYEFHEALAALEAAVGRPLRP